jgi:hypothetical protein
MKHLLFMGVYALALGLPGAAFAQSEVAFDYPHAAYMGTLGSQQAERPQNMLPPVEMKPSDVRNICPQNDSCVFFVNKSGFRVTQLQYATALDASTGKYVWAGLMAPNVYLYNNKWNFVRRPISMCSMAFKVSIDYHGHTVEEEDTFDFCGDGTPSYVTIRKPHHPYVIVEPNPSDAPPAVIASVAPLAIPTAQPPAPAVSASSPPPTPAITASPVSTLPPAPTTSAQEPLTAEGPK